MSAPCCHGTHCRNAEPQLASLPMTRTMHALAVDHTPLHASRLQALVYQTGLPDRHRKETPEESTVTLSARCVAEVHSLSLVAGPFRPLIQLDPHHWTSLPVLTSSNLRVFQDRVDNKTLGVDWPRGPNPAGSYAARLFFQDFRQNLDYASKRWVAIVPRSPWFLCT